MYDASVSRFDRWLVNQQRQTNDCVLDFSIHPNIENFEVKYLPLPGSYNTKFNFPLYSIIPSLKNIKKPSGIAVFSSWMPFEICDGDKLLLTTPVLQFWL